MAERDEAGTRGRPILGIAVPTAVLLAILVAGSATATHGTGPIVVDDDPGAGDYSSIQAAIDHANPGDTIEVAEGSYAESLSVNKANLTLQADRAEPAQILLADRSDQVAITADDVTLEGFEIQKSASQAVVSLGADNVTLDDNRISSSGGDLARGIDLGTNADPAEGIVLTDNEFSSLDSGAFSVNVDGLNASSNSFESITEGGLVVDSAGADITLNGNTATDANGLVLVFDDYFQDAPLQDLSAELTLSNNSLANTDELLIAVETDSLIQTSVDGAPSGAKILVPPGTYGESLTVRTQDLTICSTTTDYQRCSGNADEVTIDGSEAGDNDPTDWAVRVHADDLTLTGINFTVSDTSASRGIIELRGVDGFTLTDSIVEGRGLIGDDTTGIAAFLGASNARIENNRILGSFDADTDDADAAARWAIFEGVRNSLIKDNLIAGWIHGIDLDPGGNRIEGNTFLGVYNAVIIECRSPATEVVDNDFQAHQVSLWIHCRNSLPVGDATIVRQNRFSGSAAAINHVNTASTEHVVDARLNDWRLYEADALDTRVFSSGPSQILQVPFQLPDGSSEPGLVRNGDTGERFGSIQEAVDAASSGDTILVGASVDPTTPTPWAESVSVDVQGLTLCGTVRGGQICGGDIGTGHQQLSRAEWADAPGVGSGEAVLFDNPATPDHRSTSYFPPEDTKVEEVAPFAFDLYLAEGSCSQLDLGGTIAIDETPDDGSHDRDRLVTITPNITAECRQGDWFHVDFLDDDTRWNFAGDQTRQEAIDSVNAAYPDGNYEVSAVNVVTTDEKTVVYLDNQVISDVVLGERQDVTCFFTASQACRQDTARERTLVDGTGIDGAPVTLAANDTTARGLTLTDADGDHGIQIASDTAGVVVAENLVRPGPLADDEITASGVHVGRHADSAHVVDNRIRGWKNGVKVARGAAPVIEANTIASSALKGIQVRCGDTPATILDNTFVQNPIGVNVCGDGVTLRENALGLSNGLALVSTPASQGITIDARLNDWGIVGEPAIRASRILDQGQDNVILVKPYLDSAGNAHPPLPEIWCFVDEDDDPSTAAPLTKVATALGLQEAEDLALPAECIDRDEDGRVHRTIVLGEDIEAYDGATVDTEVTIVSGGLTAVHHQTDHATDGGARILASADQPALEFVPGGEGDGTSPEVVGVTVQVSDASATGIRVAADDVRLQDVLALGNGTGIAFQGTATDGELASSTVETQGPRAGVLVDGDTTGVVVRDSVLAHVAENADIDANGVHVAKHAQAVQITANEITGWDRGIFGQSENSVDVDANAFADNVVAVQLFGNAFETRLESNTFAANAVGLFVQGSGTEPTIVLRNNTFNPATAIAVATAQGSTGRTIDARLNDWGVLGEDVIRTSRINDQGDNTILVKPYRDSAGDPHPPFPEVWCFTQGTLSLVETALDLQAAEDLTLPAACQDRDGDGRVHRTIVLSEDLEPYDGALVDTPVTVLTTNTGEAVPTTRAGLARIVATSQAPALAFTPGSEGSTVQTVHLDVANAARGLTTTDLDPSSARVEVEDVRFTGDGTGLEATQGRAPLVRESTFVGLARALAFDGTQGGHLDGNRFLLTTSQTAGSTQGILLEATEGLTVERNLVSMDTKPPGLGATVQAIRAQDGHNLTLEDNVLDGDEHPAFTGLSIEALQDLRLLDNEITDARRAIELTGTPDAQVSQNTVTASGLGLQANDAPGLAVLENTFTHAGSGSSPDATEVGIRLGPATDDAELEANRIDDWAIGVELVGPPGPSSPTLRGNHLSSSNEVALALGSDTADRSVDAERNDWEVYNCDAIEAQIRDAGRNNTVDFRPFLGPDGEPRTGCEERSDDGDVFLNAAEWTAASDPSDTNSNPITSARNPVVNPGFEAGITGWLPLDNGTGEAPELAEHETVSGPTGQALALTSDGSGDTRIVQRFSLPDQGLPLVRDGAQLRVDLLAVSEGTATATVCYGEDPCLANVGAKREPLSLGENRIPLQNTQGEQLSRIALFAPAADGAKAVFDNVEITDARREPVFVCDAAAGQRCSRNVAFTGTASVSATDGVVLVVQRLDLDRFEVQAVDAKTGNQVPLAPISQVGNGTGECVGPNAEAGCGGHGLRMHAAAQGDADPTTGRFLEQRIDETGGRWQIDLVSRPSSAIPVTVRLDAQLANGDTAEAFYNPAKLTTPLDVLDAAPYPTFL